MPHIILYSLLALLAINYHKIKHIKSLEVLVYCLIIIVLSTRWRVGGDWGTYTIYFDQIYNRDPLNSSLFYAINYASNFLNLNVFGKNIILFILFFFPLLYFIKSLNTNTYLLLCISFPIIILIYGIGSVRQGLAIVYFLLFLAYKKNNLIKLFLFILPAFFHNSAIFINVFYVISQFLKFDKKFFIYLPIIAIVLYIILFLFKDQLNHYIYYYVTQNFYHSKGAFIRGLLLSLYSLAFLIIYKKIKIDESIKNYLFFSSLFIILVLPLTVIYATAVDRVLGYFMIIKLYVSYYILIYFDKKYEKLITIIFILSYFSILVGWLYIGEMARFWLDYEIIFFGTKDDEAIPF